MEVLKDSRDMFGVDFDKNKEALNQISTIRSKMLRNELAGYITKFIKNELRNEEMKTKAVENEEDVLEETAHTQAEPASEPIVEETPADKVQD
jgi:small subunit ribosomal protein S17e